ncbi:N-acetyltransferase family protein [Actinomycetota bacterium]|nr:GNAT family N-acetyltransferase [Micrococcales bacterium]
MSLEIRPANQATWEDLQTLFGERGAAAECQCQRYRLARGESFRGTPVEVRAQRLREQTACGDPRSPGTSGLVAYRDGSPVGWCAVSPRADLAGLVRNSNQTAWRGRDEDRTDPAVWAVTCLFVRPGERGQGVAHELASAAVAFARERGAARLEAYPITVDHADWGEEHPGPLSVYLAAGFKVVHTPSKRRAVVSVDLA